MIEQLLPADCDIATQDGRPVLESQRFGDFYFSPEGGLEETRLVFIDGNRLKQRLPGRRHFTIAETGFGTGLNFLATLALIDALGEAAPPVTYIASEIAPLDAEVIAKVLSVYPEIAPYLDQLIKVLPPRWPGRHRRLFLGGKVALDLLYGDSVQRFRESRFHADAWFLDGFAPSRNPQMWTKEVFELLALRSASGASLASFSAAGEVRRGLEEAGFEIAREDGFGRKRHRITGQLKASTETAVHPPKDQGPVVVIGAGIAAASVAHALRRQGVEPLLVTAGDSLADGASGNIAAVQSPRLTAADTFPGRLSLTAWGYARYLAEATGASIDRGSMIYAHNDRETQRQAKIAEQGWPETVFRRICAAEAAALTGVNTGLGGSFFPFGGTVDPRQLVAALLNGIECRFGTRIEKIEEMEGRVRLHHGDGVIDAAQIILATGYGLAQMLQPYFSPAIFQVTAGHVSHLPGEALELAAGLSFGGYMARADKGLVALGASFDHLDPASPMPEATIEGHEKNRAKLPQAVQGSLPEMATWQGRVSLRLAVPDRQPLAGQLAERVHVLAGLGARGMVTAPILGEHVASAITGAPSPLDQGMQSVVDPQRFAAGQR